MKKCTKCLTDKEGFEFSFKNKSKGTLNHICKACHKIYRDNHYAENRSKYITEAANRRIKYKQEFYSWLLDKKCVDCRTSDIRVLEFDHLKDKKFNIAEGIGCMPLSSLMKEIDKCDIVCANCHRIRTAVQFNYYNYADIKLDNN